MSKENSLTECLFSLIASFNTTLDRLSTLAEKQRKLLIKNEEIFKLAREDFFRGLIEAEVDRQIENNTSKKSMSFGNEIVRRTKGS